MDQSEAFEVLLNSSREGDADRAEALLQRWPELDINVRDRRTGNTALMWAASRSHAKVVQVLLQYGADQTLVNREQQTAFELASPSIQRQLLTGTSDTSCTANHALLQSAWLCNVEAVRRLLTHKETPAEVNCTNPDGFSPLLLLARGLALSERFSELSGNPPRPVETAEALLKGGASPVDAEAATGHTALHLACASRSRYGPSLVEALLRHGADALARDRCAFTPLHSAAQAGDVGAIRVLVQHLGTEAKLDIRGRAGSTPLHLCAMAGYEDAVRFLLKAGANPQNVDEGGQTPIEVAKNRRIKAILQGKTPPPDSASSAAGGAQKKALGPVRAPARLARTRSFGAAKEATMPAEGEAASRLERTPSDLALEGSHMAAVTPRLGALSRSSNIGLSATTPIPPSRPDSGSLFLARNSLFRRSTPSRTSRPMPAFHLPPVTPAKSPGPLFAPRRGSTPSGGAGGDVELMEGMRGRASTRTYLEDLEDCAVMPASMAPGVSTEELDIPDTIVEANVESAGSSRFSAAAGHDLLPSPVIQVQRVSTRRRNVTFSQEDVSGGGGGGVGGGGGGSGGGGGGGGSTVDVRRSLEFASPRLASGRRHARTGSCPEVDVAVAAEETKETSPRAALEPTSTPVPSNVGLKAVRVSKEASTVRASGPPTNVKKPAVTKLKAPLVSTPVQGRGGVKMSPIKGRSMVLSDKQKSERLRKVASRPTPDVAKAAASPTGVVLKMSAAPQKSALKISPRSEEEADSPKASDEGMKSARNTQENPVKATKELKGVEEPKSILKITEEEDEDKTPRPSEEFKTSVKSSEDFKPSGKLQDEQQVIVKSQEEPKLSTKHQEESKVASKVAGSSKTAVKASEEDSVAAAPKTPKTPSAKASGRTPHTTRPVVPPKETLQRTGAKALSKRKVSANSGTRRRPRKRPEKPSQERSSSPTIPSPADGTALISGIGWHVHTTADATDIDPTPVLVGSPRSTIFASKYPVIGAIGSQSFDAEEEEEDSEDGEYVRPHPRSQLDMATPSLPLRENFDYDNDPTPRNRNLDDHRLFAVEVNKRESQLPPVPEPSDVHDIDGPLFDEVMPFEPDSSSESDPVEDVEEEIVEAVGDDTLIDLDDDEDDMASNAEWHRRVEANNYLDLMRKCSRADFVRDRQVSETPASVASAAEPPAAPSRVAQGQFEQSWRRDTLASNASSIGPGDTLRSNFSEASTMDTEAGDMRFEELSWKRGNLLGRGSYGRVFCGMTNWGQLIAVKQIEISSEECAMAELHKIEEEIHLLKTLKHRHIVQFFGTSRTTDTVNIFMEYLPGGSIAALLNRFGVFEERVFSRYARQVLDGVSFLHANNIIHRDIKGANLMLMPNGRIKLIDFGCAKRLVHRCSQPQLQNTMQGSPYWMAPEVILETGHGPKSDCWSIGCTVFEMATTKPPWANLPPYPALFAIGSGEGEVPALDPSKFSAAACAFVARCLTRNPDDRPSSAELLEDPFVVRRRNSNVVPL